MKSSWKNKIGLKINLLSLLFILLLHSIVNATESNPPDWVLNRPTSTLDYIGIGIANKSKNNDYIQIAKNNALKDLISEISIKIEGNSLLSQSEIDEKIKEKYESSVKTTFSQELEDYEVVDSYENNNQFWIYYKLSKAKYRFNKEEKLKKAKNISFDYFKKAKAFEKNRDVNNAIIFYIKSFSSIEKHLKENLEILYKDQKIYLANEIYKSILDLFSKINLKSDNKHYITKVFSNINKPIQIHCQFISENIKTKIENLPLIFNYSNDKYFKVNSDNNGNGICHKLNHIYKGKNQTISVLLDIKEYFKKESVLFEMLNSKNITPSFLANVDVIPLNIYLSSKTYLNDKFLDTGNSSSKYLVNYLSKKYFLFTQNENEAELKINIKTKINKGNIIKGDMFNMQEMFLKLDFSLIEIKTNKTIVSKNISNIKSLTNTNESFESTLIKLNKIAIKKIKKQLLPKLEKINL